MKFEHIQRTTGKCGRCAKREELVGRFEDASGKAVRLCTPCADKAYEYVERSAAPAQLPQSPTADEVGPVAAETPAATGKWPSHTPPNDFCQVHQRMLAYSEIESGACWWCTPSMAPEGHAVHRLSNDQLEALKRR